MSKPMSYEGVEIEKRTLKTRILFSVPGAGVEPARIAPTVFETVASTDSAIRASSNRFCADKGKHYFASSQCNSPFFSAIMIFLLCFWLFQSIFN